MTENTETGFEHFRPVTDGYSRFETVYIPRVKEAVLRFRETGEPVSLWTHGQWSDSGRLATLTDEELNRQIKAIFELCAVEDSFHDSIKLLKKPFHDSSIIPDEKTFGNYKPNPTDIMQWLGDFDTLKRDDPNEFVVGFVLDSPVGLVVLKYSSEEAGYCCAECNPIAGYSCEHFAGEYATHDIYQISLFAEDYIDRIDFTPSEYGLQP